MPSRVSAIALPYVVRYAKALALTSACALAGCGQGDAASIPDAGRDAGPTRDAGPGNPSLGGGASGDPLGPGDASTAHRVAILFATTCAGGPEAHCHGGGNYAGGLSLVLTPDGGDVIGVPSLEDPTTLRVRPGDPAHSYVERKVMENGSVDGGRMPLGEAYDPRIEALVRAWIAEGAPQSRPR